MTWKNVLLKLLWCKIGVIFKQYILKNKLGSKTISL